MKLFDYLFSKNDSFLLEEYISNLEESSDIVNIIGPFINFKYTLNHYAVYKELLKKTYYNINVYINRRLTLISKDPAFEMLDNNRIKLGISPFNHRFGLFIHNNDFTIITVDDYIIQNELDAKNIKSILCKKFPLTEKELGKIKNVSKH